MKNDHPLSFAWSLQPLMGICGTVINSFVLYMQYCERQTFIRPVNAMIWYVRANPKQALRNSCELLRRRRNCIKAHDCMQAHGTSCKLIELHASSGNCMQAYVIACKLMDLHAFWNILHAFWNILHAFWNILLYIFNFVHGHTH